MMESLELLYDHYKDTFEILKEKIKQRDRKFVLSFIFSCILILFTFNPTEYQSLIIGFINSKYSIDVSNQFAVIQTFLWIAVLYETLRYSQAFVNIERIYHYLGSLERRISDLSGQQIDRESGDYAKSFSIASKYANTIYKYVFPVFSIVVAMMKMVSEFSSQNAWYFTLIDAVLCLAYMVLWVCHSIFAIKND